MIVRRSVLIVVACALLAAACTKSAGTGSAPTTPTPDARFIGFDGHDIPLRAPPLGRRDRVVLELTVRRRPARDVRERPGGVHVPRRPERAGHLRHAGNPGQRRATLPAPTTQATGTGPSLSDPSTARGVYDARATTFDHPGLVGGHRGGRRGGFRTGRGEHHPLRRLREAGAPRARPAGAEDREPHDVDPGRAAGLARLARARPQRQRPRPVDPPMDDREGARRAPADPGGVLHARLLHQPVLRPHDRRRRAARRRPMRTAPCSSTWRSTRATRTAERS